MILRFLGSGTSTGVPVMRCNCDVCRSKDPRDNRMRASVIIQSEPGAPWVLIDCGPDFRAQMLRIGSPDLACALITHSHYDHVGGIDDLRPYTHTCPGAHFPVICRPDVATDLRNRVPYCFREHPYPGVPQFNLLEHLPGDEVTVCPGEGFRPLKIKLLEVLHGRLPIIGFRIGPLAYITDASYFPPETITELQGLDTLVINALREKSHPSHQNLKEALGVIQLTRPRKAYLTHMCHDIGLAADIDRKLPDGVRFAYDGLTVDIPNNGLNESESHIPRHSSHQNN